MTLELSYIKKNTHCVAIYRSKSSTIQFSAQSLPKVGYGNSKVNLNILILRRWLDITRI
jgi:hypothetical protein